MAATNIDLLAYSDALLVLGTAGVIVPAVHRWRVNPVLAFLVAGAVLGPLGLGSFKDIWPNLQWVTITDAKNVASIAELGVVFLMFLIGLELSYERLLTMRRLVFGLGSLQASSRPSPSAPLPPCSAAREPPPSSSACAWRCPRRRSSSSCCPSSAG